MSRTRSLTAVPPALRGWVLPALILLFWWWAVASGWSTSPLLVSRIASDRRHSPSSTSVSPGLEGSSKRRCRSGRRRSQLTTATRCPAWARAAARLIAVRHDAAADRRLIEETIAGLG